MSERFESIGEFGKEGSIYPKAWPCLKRLHPTWPQIKQIQRSWRKHRNEEEWRRSIEPLLNHIRNTIDHRSFPVFEHIDRLDNWRSKSHSIRERMSQWENPILYQLSPHLIKQSPWKEWLHKMVKTPERLSSWKKIFQHSLRIHFTLPFVRDKCNREVIQSDQESDRNLPRGTQRSTADRFTSNFVTLALLVMSTFETKAKWQTPFSMELNWRLL